MATRSAIGFKKIDGTIEAVYCHWDGYPSHNGKTLLNRYNDISIVNQLMLLGDLSSLREKLYPDDSKPHTFQNQQEDVCVAYGRERNESDVGSKIFKDIGDFERFAGNSDAEYQYLFNSGKWTYREINRDDKWKEQTIKNTSEAQFNTEFECEFLGSIDTLISPSKLRVLTYKTPIQSTAGVDIYELPQPEHTYLLTADVARGTSNDYSAFIVFDVTSVPYTIVAKFRDNEIKPLLFPQKIHQIAKVYNTAFVLVEVNDIGEQVANAMHYDMEYDNMIMASMRGRAGQVLGGGFSGGRAQLGVRTTKAVKSIGCSNLKQLVEDNKLIVEDFDTINELSTFIVKGSSFEADDGCNDDMVACLFIFAWCTDQTYFKELTNNDIREQMYRENQDQLEQDMAPFGFVVNGLEDENIGEIVDEYGTRWSPIVRDYGSNW